MKQEITKNELHIFTRNIAWLRKHYGLSKKQMAKLLEIGLWSINKIENGQIPPRLTIDIIEQVHKCFGIAPVVLFRDDLDTLYVLK